jgi:hypothetical protein
MRAWINPARTRRAGLPIGFILHTGQPFCIDFMNSPAGEKALRRPFQDGPESVPWILSSFPLILWVNHTTMQEAR